MNCLTDEQIQDYLDEMSTGNQEKADNHLRQCCSCREQVNAYRLVYKSSRTAVSVSFSCDFEDRILMKLIPYRPASFQWTDWLAWGFSALCLLGLAGTGGFAGWLIYRSPFFKRMLQEIQNIEGMAAGFPLLITAVISVFVFQLMDRWFIKKNLHSLRHATVHKH